VSERPTNVYTIDDDFKVRFKGPTPSIEKRQDAKENARHLLSKHQLPDGLIYFGIQPVVVKFGYDADHNPIAIGNYFVAHISDHSDSAKILDFIPFP